MKSRLLTGLFIGALGSGAFAAELPKMQNGVLVDPAGRTLYTFDKDAVGKSNCNDGCAAAWPPLLAAGEAKAAGDWSIIVRDDGSKQWAYEGKPLYHWSKDQKPGDMMGDAFNGVWHVVKG
jgi:predicted lipoprotein with Yx(FWY)xxD motif